MFGRKWEKEKEKLKLLLFAPFGFSFIIREKKESEKDGGPYKLFLEKKFQFWGEMEGLRLNDLGEI